MNSEGPLGESYSSATGGTHLTGIGLGFRALGSAAFGVKAEFRALKPKDWLRRTGTLGLKSTSRSECKNEGPANFQDHTVPGL